MIEATTSAQSRTAIEAAHAARGAALRDLITAIRTLFSKGSANPAPAALAH